MIICFQKLIKTIKFVNGKVNFVYIGIDKVVFVVDMIKESDVRAEGSWGILGAVG